MPPAKRKRTVSPKSRSTKSKKRSWLHSFLYILIVFLVLTAIALAAGYVYVRNSDIKTHANELSMAQKAPSAQAVLSDTQLNGTWINAENGNMLTVQDGRFSLDFPSVEAKKTKQGVFFVSNNHIVIETNISVDCASEKGTYTFVLEHENLTITTLNDACMLRKSLFAASWYRM